MLIAFSAMQKWAQKHQHTVPEGEPQDGLFAALLGRLAGGFSAAWHLCQSGENNQLLLGRHVWRIS